VSLENVFPHTLFYIGHLPIRDTVVHTWIIVGALCTFAVWAKNRFRTWHPKRWQLLVEYLIEYVESLVIDMGGKSIRDIVPYLTTMITFIAIANLLGLLPTLRAPTRDLNTTAALAAVSLASVQYYGIRKRGFKTYLASFFEPVFILFPLNISGQISRTFSMAVRLFGNVVAGEIIGAVMFLLLPALGPLPLSLLSTITGLLQALVFTILTIVFVIDATTASE